MKQRCEKVHLVQVRFPRGVGGGKQGRRVALSLALLEIHRDTVFAA